MNTTTRQSGNGNAFELPISRAERHERDGEPRIALSVLAPVLDAIERNDLDDRAAVVALSIASNCAFRMADYVGGMRYITSIESRANRSADRGAHAIALIHRARICYQQGRYSEGRNLAEDAAKIALDRGDWVLAARARMCQDYIAMGQADYPAAERYICESVALAGKGNDRYIESWVLNSAGLHYYYLALAKVLPHHLRGHPSSAEPKDFDNARDEILKSVAYFKRATKLAIKCGEQHHAGIVEANHLRVRIMLGEAKSALTPLRRILRQCQNLGLKDNELALRHTYAWALRTCGYFAEAAQQIDAALVLARKLGRVNRIVELLHYDRSLVQASLGNQASALTSYRRYLRSRAQFAPAAGEPAAPQVATTTHPPLEPFYMKKADQFLAAHAVQPFELGTLARHCGVSARCLQLGFKKFRGVTPMACARNLRLDAVHRELQTGTPTVALVATQFGFKSLTTFSTEYRRRFGVPPRLTVAEARKQILNGVTA